jgi:superfamily II DNA or RNA helicase
MATEPIFIPGMYVRLPSQDEIGRDDGEFRDFRLGRIVSIDDISQTAEVAMQTHAPDQPPQCVGLECGLHLLERCHILPNTRFTHIPTGNDGTILVACDDTLPPGTFCAYYASLNGHTTQVCEADITVSDTRQDPSPVDQLRRYEFHSPVWKANRDLLMEDYSELHNASFGIEDLVGSRVMLLPHQADVITTVLSSTECRFMLADEVGLGKTIETCVILKSLRRREPGMKTLIIVPASLVQQWYHELNEKFWLDFAVARPGTKVSFPPDCPGVIISAEDLTTYEVYWQWINTRTWGLVIADEAHHLRKNPLLYERVQHLSRTTERVLILTATPIQRYADEYLSLLKLLDPVRYDPMDNAAFQRIRSAQNRVRQAIVYLKPSLTDETFDGEEFQEEVESLMAELEHDEVLASLSTKMNALADDQAGALNIAREIVAYISENYRIERRIIRNRRASLSIPLPKRQLDTTASYQPESEEQVALDELYGYLEFLLDQFPHEPPYLEYSRVLLHAAASSPNALLALLEWREQGLRHPHSVSPGDLAKLATPADPRREAERVKQLVQAVPVLADEADILHRLLWHTRQWHEQTEQELQHVSLRELSATNESPHRLVQVLRALYPIMNQSTGYKVVVFSRWSQTLAALCSALDRFFPPGAVAQFHAALRQDELQCAVDRFQAEETCRILLCDELGGEGRNFQIADAIIHVDLPWTPTQIEQRIGRVDRLGRTEDVSSIVPFARDSLEHDLFRIWQEAFHLFTRSLSGMEIALESIQTELARSLTQSIRHGLDRILAEMVKRGEQLHEDVEEERYFEEGAINYRLRDQFQTMRNRYRDGSRLRQSFLPWARLAGLTCQYSQSHDTVQFYPKDFNLKSMKNAKFLPPNMEEALRRSGNKRNPVITGTFNRDKAVQREDLVFFAPSDDPWTDAIIANAMEADRGRCCAIRRFIPDLEQDWQGLELFYRLQLDPRPLYAAGYDSSHLFRAQGFLMTTTHRMLLSDEGQVLKKSNPIWQHLKTRFNKQTDVHLGKREAPGAQLADFKDRYPLDVWHSLLEYLLPIAESHIHDEYAFTEELAEEAKQEFAHHVAGWRAARRWLARQTGKPLDTEEIAEYERISTRLVEGLHHPIIKLESVCFWELQRKQDC